jgi:23S rRNA (uridine2552-2'-O)-methyltransferase
LGQLRDRRHRHDAFFRKARRQGFAARAVYKLEDIDRRVRLFHAGARVLDLGCCPGSWLQYAVKAVGRHGKVVGVDRLPLPVPVPGARVLTADVCALSDEELLCGLAAFDVVLSDMAPDTTGIRATDQARSANLAAEALGRAERLLAPLGAFVAKVFQSPDVEKLRRRMARRFVDVRLLKPEASRQQSTELYLVGKNFGPERQPKRH